MFDKTNVIVMTGAFMSILLLIVARHHPPSRRKIKEIWHGRVYWDNTTMLRLTQKKMSDGTPTGQKAPAPTQDFTYFSQYETPKLSTSHWCHSRDILKDGGKRASCVFKNICFVATPNGKQEIEWLYINQNVPKDASFSLGVGVHSDDDRLFFHPRLMSKDMFEQTYKDVIRVDGVSAAFYEYNGENFGHFIPDILLPIYSAMDAVDLVTNDVKLFRYKMKNPLGWSCDYQVKVGRNKNAKRNCEMFYKKLPPLVTRHPVTIMKPKTEIPTCFDTLFVGMSQYSDDCMWSNAPSEKSKWSLCNHGRQKQFWNFRQNALRNMNVSLQAPTKHKITITKRGDGVHKRSHWENFDEFVKTVQMRFKDIEVSVVQWHTMSMVEQLKTISQTTVHVTPVGGVSVIGMFLPRWATQIHPYNPKDTSEWYIFNYLGYIHNEWVNLKNGNIHVEAMLKYIQEGLERYTSYL